MTASSPQIRRAAIAEIRPLRHAILRAGMAPEAGRFDGDDDPTTRHFGAFDEAGVVLACLSFMLNAFEGEPAWQLRGMAVKAGRQGQGIGARLLGCATEEIHRLAAARLLWCNARVPAVGFYLRQGWEICSEPFEIPTAGPHGRKTRRLPLSTPTV